MAFWRGQARLGVCGSSGTTWSGTEAPKACSRIKDSWSRSEDADKVANRELTLGAGRYLLQVGKLKFRWVELR